MEKTYKCHLTMTKFVSSFLSFHNLSRLFLILHHLWTLYQVLCKKSVVKWHSIFLSITQCKCQLPLAYYTHFVDQFLFHQFHSRCRSFLSAFELQIQGLYRNSVGSKCRSLWKQKEKQTRLKQLAWFCMKSLLMTLFLRIRSSSVCK